MTGTILMILFLLHVLMAFAVLLLFMRQNRLVELEKRQKLMLQESEQVIASLVQEIKEENEAFLKKIQEAQNHSGNDQDSQTHKEQSEDAPEFLKNAGKNHIKVIAAQAYQKDKPGASEPESLDDQVKALYAKGLTVSEIARTLHKGKTEVELLLKFRS